jgi:hypothetical protein
MTGGGIGSVRIGGGVVADRDLLVRRHRHLVLLRPLLAVARRHRRHRLARPGGSRTVGHADLRRWRPSPHHRRVVFERPRRLRQRAPVGGRRADPGTLGTVLRLRAADHVVLPGLLVDHRGDSRPRPASPASRSPTSRSGSSRCAASRPCASGCPRSRRPRCAAPSKRRRTGVHLLGDRLADLCRRAPCLCSYTDDGDSPEASSF